MSLIRTAVLPAEKAEAVENALQSAFNTANITDIHLLSGGLSGSAVYKITVADRHYLLKLNQPIQSHKTTDDATNKVAEAGIAPHLHYSNNITGISISDFIDNQPIRTVLLQMSW